MSQVHHTLDSSGMFPLKFNQGYLLQNYNSSLIFWDSLFRKEITGYAKFLELSIA